MNNQQSSPLVPQGVPLDPKNSGRARVKIAILFVLIVHGIGLMALLIQGCRREEAPPPQTDVATNEMVAPEMDTNVPAMDPATPPTLTNAMVEPVAPEAVTSAPPVAPVTPVAPAISPSTSEYKVAQNDTFTSIAKKFGVSVKAIVDANPNVNPNRLQIGQNLMIPAPTAAPAAESSVAAPVAGGGGGEQSYTVKSGDNLTKIGARFGVTPKAIRNANNLQTDRITVGQKLKIPAKAQ